MLPASDRAAALRQLQLQVRRVCTIYCLLSCAASAGRPTPLRLIRGTFARAGAPETEEVGV